MVEQIQKNYQKEIDEMKKIHKEFKLLQEQRQQLTVQLNENEVVKTELDHIKDNEEVFKMIGKVLIKQDLTEAKQNVIKRMDYIKNELKRIDNSIKVTDMKMEETRAKTIKLQQEFQELLISKAGKK